MQKYVVAAMLMLACLVGASARDVKEAQAALRTELHGTAAPPTVNVQPEVPIRKATQEMRGAQESQAKKSEKKEKQNTELTKATPPPADQDATEEKKGTPAPDKKDRSKTELPKATPSPGTDYDKKKEKAELPRATPTLGKDSDKKDKPHTERPKSTPPPP
jgi:hypothetical protein